MKLKKILQNSIMETTFYIVLAVVGLLKVKYIILGLGSEMNGYYQFINNIISYIILAEAGISTAILYKMYKPMADNDQNKVSELFNGSRKILKNIGFLFIGIALVVLPILYFYTKEISLFIKISFCFLLLIISVALPYICGTRSYTTVLTADQKRFVYGFVYNASRLLTDIFIIILVLIFKSIYAIVIINLLFKILETIIITAYCKKKYNWIDKSKKPDTSAKKMSGDMLCHQIGGVVFNNVDSLLLMTFLGPVYVSIYSSYNYIITFIKEIFDKNNQMIANVFGYSFAKKEDNLIGLYKSYCSVFAALGLIICICFLLGARGFINLWIDKANYILDFHVIYAFSFIILFNILLTNINTIFQANGLFKESKYFPIIESVLNVILSIILLQWYGILGILIATSISNLIGLLLRTKLLKEKVFVNNTYFSLIKRPLIAILLFLILSFLLFNLEAYYLTFSISYIKWFAIMLLTFVVVSILVLLCYLLFDKAMQRNFEIVFNKLKKRDKYE